MKILYFTGAIVLLDQITKILVKGFSIPFFDFHHVGYSIGTSFPVIGDLVRFTYIENPGIAFGIDIGGKLFLTLFTIAASVGIFIYLVKKKHQPFIIKCSLALILGGAIGNLIDRVFYGVFYGEAPLFYGRVVDFIDVDFFNISLFGFEMTRWPVFNIADASVSTGVVLLLIFHNKISQPAQDSNVITSFVSGPTISNEPSRHVEGSKKETP